MVFTLFHLVLVNFHCNVWCKVSITKDAIAKHGCYRWNSVSLLNNLNGWYIALLY
ncbi:hypothetical protein SAMN05421788_1011172 [Filimonas lacunae]|uniref:Uncharacterized protein n=1 Tax=Filimonas lacunae TaxID=477680 RepID=A0A173MQH2_9BACT|nr:hypothetical protein [Filimonas lacunae]BAV09737.1 hypothetical protein FLA_5790 [Filimonas lacunae]SIS78179.1 hypothetical protein SAMN05421788_1011172 [Filimonas lacunae]